MKEEDARKLKIGDRLVWLVNSQIATVVDIMGGDHAGIILEWHDTNRSWVEYNQLGKYRRFES